MSTTAPAKTIKTPLHHSGEIPVRNGSTGFTFLPAIFAISQTRAVYDEKAGMEPFQTDAAGLERLADMAEQAGESALDAVRVVGDLLAHCDTKQLGPHTLKSLGFFLCGMCDLKQGLADIQSDMDYQLKQVSGGGR